MTSRWRLSLSAVFLLVSTRAALAEETIYLRDGTVLHGEWLGKKDGVYEFQTTVGPLSIHEDRILKIEFGEPPVKPYGAAAATTDSETPHAVKPPREPFQFPFLRYAPPSKGDWEVGAAFGLSRGARELPFPVEGTPGDPNSASFSLSPWVGWFATDRLEIVGAVTVNPGASRTVKAGASYVALSTHAIWLGPVATIGGFSTRQTQSDGGSGYTGIEVVAGAVAKVRTSRHSVLSVGGDVATDFYTATVTRPRITNPGGVSNQPRQSARAWDPGVSARLGYSISF